ncbi:MAG: AtpZ/AtpI family protein [Candidatus Kerfeldbacteria bacterium]
MTDENPKQPEQNGQRGMILQALGFAWDFGIVVVMPLVVLGILGRFLDRHFGTTPWLFLGSVLVSIVLSVFLLVVRLKKIISRVTDASKNTTPKK